MTAEKSRRNDAIVKMYQAGESLAAISKQVDMTRQRVHQIVQAKVQIPRTILDARNEQRCKALIALIAPLIKAGFTRAEIVRQGVFGGDVQFLQKHAPAIFEDHHQHVAFRKYGMSEDQLDELAAPYQKPWRKFKAMYDVARHIAITKRQKQWLLPFVEWFKLWSQSGAWRLGNINEWPRHGMILIDQGLPYQVGNVRIIPMSLVSQEWFRNNKRAARSY